MTIDDLGPLDEVLPIDTAAEEEARRPLLLSGAIFDKPRRFLLNRSEGVTGSGAVAWGCAWPSGRVCLDWNTTPAMSGGVYASMEDVMTLHGAHTSIEWVDC